ncbi:MarR family winged helix-turn-helix transcriptional regulator [Rhodococcus chondri]|uniref:MarR family transcriptional regulator n=1 Tax=Rhodococcus chondri TaxID=3065941 RepID=A0ABU7JRH3_9NOCA|nr:MarR family transcriptional regulator [Rhodococcus sp. CC-R104]MEE2032425.1 MarR family transcriptional regulator [Rhodococcus sp. CC-R104]
MAVQPDTARELVDAIFLFARTLRTTLVHHDSDLLPSALTGVLFLLARTGECRPSELAAEICVSQSALSRQIGELVDRGFVDRHPDPNDKRAHLVSCSPDGREILRTIQERRTERLTAELTDWDQQQVVEALAVVGRLNSTLAPIAGSTPQRTSS